MKHSELLKSEALLKSLDLQIIQRYHNNVYRMVSLPCKFSFVNTRRLIKQLKTKLEHFQSSFFILQEQQVKLNVFICNKQPNIYLC